MKRVYILPVYVVVLLFLFGLLLPFAFAASGDGVSPMTSTVIDTNPNVHEVSINVTEGEVLEGSVSKVELSKGVSRFEAGGYWIKSTLISPEVVFSSVSIGNELTWSSPDLDIVITYLDMTLKESIVVRDSGITSVVFLLEHNGELELNPDGSIYLVDYSNGVFPFIGIEPPTAFDNRSAPVDVSYSLDGDTLTLRILTKLDPSRYPITIDPTYTVQSGTVSGAINQTEQRKMVGLSNGDWVICYLDSNPEQVWAIYSSDLGQNWSGAERVDGINNYDKQHVGILANEDDDVFVYWHDADRQGIYGVWGSGDPLSWGSVETCVDRANIDQYPSASMDSSGGVHLVWQANNLGGTSDNDIGYIYRHPSTGWGTPVVVCNYSGYSQGFPCIAVDSSEDLHVVWAGKGGSVTNLTKGNIYYRKYDGSWGSEEYLTDLNQDQNFPIVITDSNDYPCVTWYGKAHAPYTSQNQIIYRDKDGGSWNSIYVVSTTNNANTTPTIGRTSANVVVVSWYGLGYGSNPTVYNVQVKVKDAGDVWGSIVGITDNANHRYMANIYYHEHRTGQLPSAGYSLVFCAFTAYDIMIHNSSDLAYGPSVDDCDPDTGARYVSLVGVEITGDEFTGATSVGFGTGVTVDSFSVDTDELITCDITVTGSAPLGAHDVSVTTSSGTGVLSNGFTVTVGYPDPPTNFVLTRDSSTQVTLTWTESVNADTTVIRRKLLSYPTDYNDGVGVYNGTDETCVDDGLNLDTETYYYRAWSYDSTSSLYSVSYAQDRIGGETVMFIGLIVLCVGMTVVGFVFKSFPLYVLGGLCWFIFGFWGIAELTDELRIGIPLLSFGLGFLLIAYSPITNRLGRGKEKTTYEDDYFKDLDEMELESRRYQRRTPRKR